MSLALMQAKMSLGNTKQNPSVGCVITNKNNLISAGSTSFGGRPHAEKNAISLCKSNLRNSTIYVTLEPCSHYGKTPPCVNLIAKRNIKKVFFSIFDPDTRSYKKSKRKFYEKDIFVHNGILKKEINFFYRSYYKYKKKGLPFVTAKMAISKDYYTVSRYKRWITNEYSRKRANLLRSYYDCLITSSRNIIKDNPRMDCRIPGLEKNSPSRIILDTSLKINPTSKIVAAANKYRTIIFYNKIKKYKIAKLKKKKIEFYKIPINTEGKLDLKQVVLKAKKIGFSRIFIESGITLTTSFLKQNLVDDFILFVSNKNLGKNGYSNAKNLCKKFLRLNKGIIEKVNLFGEKIISYKIK